MNELFSLGVILLFALLAGHLGQFLRVPEVTGYIVAGIIVGPYGLGWLNHENLMSLGVFSEVALGLILFSVGSVFEFSRFRTLGRDAALITAIESIATASLVAGGMFAVGQPWPVALLLGGIAIETAAASTMMVVRECNSSGQLTDTLTAIIAMNNILCLSTFMIVSSAIDMRAMFSAGTVSAMAVYEAIFPLIWQLVGSLALGYLIGLGLALWSSHVKEQGETLILLAGCVLLCVGVSHWLALSPLVSSLAVGATMVNLSAESRRLFHALSQTDPPLYAIFFVIAGADLNVRLLPTVGLLGVIYVVGRTIAKYFGTRWAARMTSLSEEKKRLLGFSMLSQAGLAIGLVIAINDRFPELAPIVNTVVLASVTVFELAGPLAARFALRQSGEAHEQPALEPSVL
jgi:Kef-type K+ transport system membrane component KefB